MAMPDVSLRAPARGRRAFRPPHAALEPADGAVHLRRPQPGPYPGPAADRADDGPRAARRARRGRRPAAACCSSAPRRRRPNTWRRARDPLRPVLREPPLARRHADQLEDHHGHIKRLKQMEEQLGGNIAGSHQEGDPDADAREGEARPRARRHQGDGRPARHHLRHRRGEGEAGDRGGQQARHPRRRRGRLATPIRRASPSRSRATTTRSAPSTCTATWSPARCSTASRPSCRPPASTWARPRNCRPRTLLAAGRGTAGGVRRRRCRGRREPSRPPSAATPRPRPPGRGRSLRPAASRLA